MGKSHSTLPSVISAWLLAFSANVWANTHEPAKAVPQKVNACGALQKTEGGVSLLPAERTLLLSSHEGATIECGGWLSVKKGYAELKHRDGFLIRVGSDSFLQVADPAGESTGMGSDHLVMTTGSVYVRIPDGSREVRVVTSNGRIRLRSGVFIVVYDREQESTQLIVLEKQGTLENRFLAENRMRVRHGEMTELNFKQGRAVPTEPSAIQATSLRELLATHYLSEAEKAVIVRIAKDRGSRNLAQLTSAEGAGSSVEHDLPVLEENGHAVGHQRAPASAPHGKSTHGKTAEVYSAKDPELIESTEPPSDRFARSQWEKKLVGDETEGVSLLTPVSPAKKRSPAHVGARAPASISQVIEVLDQEKRANEKRSRAEQAEKKRLMEEFSRIRVE